MEYLGIWIGNILNFRGHIEEATEQRTGENLSRLIPKVKRAQSRNRKVLCGIVHRVLLWVQCK